MTLLSVIVYRPATSLGIQGSRAHRLSDKPGGAHQQLEKSRLQAGGTVMQVLTRCRVKPKVPSATGNKPSTSSGNGHEGAHSLSDETIEFSLTAGKSPETSWGTPWKNSLAVILDQTRGSSKRLVTANKPGEQSWMNSPAVVLNHGALVSNRYQALNQPGE